MLSVGFLVLMPLSGRAMQNESLLSDFEIAPHKLRLCLRRNVDFISEKLLRELDSLKVPLSLRLKKLPDDFAQWAPSQRTSWASSRKCLVDLLLSEASQTLHVSLSHTQQASVALCCESAAVGVDLEATDREISQGVFEKLSLEAERKINLLPIELWTLKEACFKADPENLHSVLSNYEIVNYDLQLRSAKVVRKNTAKTFALRIFNWEEFTCSVAILI